jgi:hypothetical protein
VVAVQYFLHEGKVVILHPGLTVEGFSRGFESFECLVIAVWQLRDLISQGQRCSPISRFVLLDFGVHHVNENSIFC